MLRYTLPALGATALWAALCVPALAQGTAPKPAKTTMKPAVFNTAGSNVVGSVNGKPITWDAKHLKAVGEPEAERYLRKEYRKPWTLS